MKLFIKNRFTIKDINALIESNAEESLTLEFKASGSLDFENKERKESLKTELSKDISAMANSEGGIIIYGIREKNHVAHSKTFIDGNLITKERLEQVIQARIKRPIQNLKIHTIREDKSIEKSIYLIKIPRSEDSPHMAYDGAFYKRNNYNITKYMEYDLRREYLRIRKSKLQIESPVINNEFDQFHNYTNSKNGLFKIWFHITNAGKILEKDFKLEILISKNIYQSSYLGIPSLILKFKTHTLPEYHKFSIPNDAAIFPEETIRVTHAVIKVNEDVLDSEIRTKLYYSGGSEEKTFTVKDIFENQEKKEKEYQSG